MLNTHKNLIFSIIENPYNWNWVLSHFKHCDVIISRLRSNAAASNSCFFIVKQAESANCSEIETIQQYLLNCQRYVVSRYKGFVNLCKQFGGEICQFYCHVVVLALIRREELC